MPPSQRPRQFSWITACLIAVLGCLAAFVCFGIMTTAGLIGGVYLGERYIAQAQATETAQAAAFPPTWTPVVLAGVTPTPILPAVTTPTPGTLPPTATPKPDELFDLEPPAAIDQQPPAARLPADLQTLMAAHYPTHDYYESAVRLGSRDVGPRLVPTGPFQVGDIQNFYGSNGRVDAELAVVTEHVYFWVEEGLTLDRTDLAEAARRFEEDYYPLLTTLFGQEWLPGIDQDPHFSVLHLSEFGSDDELGYFDSSDEFPRTIINTSNEQEIVYLNMDLLDPGEPLYYGTLVHEMQHLIHWYVDGNETTWLDEGLAQLAETYLGLDTVDTKLDYLQNPDTQLNTWNYEDNDAVYAHYGAAYLFAVYLWEQLGEDAIKELSRHPADGLQAVQSILAGYRPDTTLEQFVADWAAANYLNDEAAGPRYHYRSIRLGRPTVERRINSIPHDELNNVPQFGVDYVELNVEGSTTISFAGDTTIPLAVPPRSGQQMWYVPGIDSLDAHLTATFDLTGLNRATFSFWAWYDLEEDWDFAYISISTDGGQSWDLLAPDHMSAAEFGPGLTGRSEDVSGNEDGWVYQTISLNNYVGQQVMLRIELLTDTAISGRGFAVDDIAIPELSYVHDVETDTGGWQANGFSQVGWQLPQQWRVQLIERNKANGGGPQVSTLPLNALNQGQWTVDLGNEGGVLVITALTPFTTETADYWLSIEP
jgi:immune inhibitor A